MAYISRDLEKEIKKTAREYPVVVVLGPRQSGKTTTVKKVFPKKDYVSLEDLDQREFALTDPKGFLSTYNKGVIIDEVQRVPDLLSYIQTKVDHSKKNGQFILTGSNQLLLEEKITQSLAGRVSLLRLLPLSFKELNSYKKITNLNEILFKGFYPKLHTEKIRTTQWLNNYIETYVDKDVRLIKNIGNLAQFHTFIKMCAARVGQPVNLNSLGNDCGLSQNTIKSWLSILESSFIIKKVAPYYKNLNRRHIKTPKIYFYDTGLLCQILSITKASDLSTHSLRGHIFENFVCSEIEKQYLNQGRKAPVYFWKDSQNHEIDFLIDDQIFKIIEVKSSQTINQNFFKNINYFKKIVKSKTKSYLVYGGIEQQKRSSAHIIPWQKIHQIFK